MISDVLFEAIIEIDNYLEGDIYRGEIRMKVLSVRTIMKMLQKELDTPPGVDDKDDDTFLFDNNGNKLSE